MWRNKNPYTLLTGVQLVLALYKISCMTNNWILGMLPPQMYTIIGVNQELVSSVYINSSTNQFWHNCTPRCYTALKKNYCNVKKSQVCIEGQSSFVYFLNSKPRGPFPGQGRKEAGWDFQLVKLESKSCLTWKFSIPNNHSRLWNVNRYSCKIIILCCYVISWNICNKKMFAV